MTDVPTTAAELERALLGGAQRYTRAEISEAAGIPLEEARRYWRALGFADVGDSAVAFTDADLDALRLLLRLVREGVVDDEFAVSLARSLGHTLARLVAWQVEAMVEHLTERRALSPAETPRAAAETIGEHLDDFERLLVHAWRRQLAAIAGRTLLPGDTRSRSASLSVGFADLVGFSRLAGRLEERELGHLVSRFESIATDLVAAQSGRVVKTVGDEVLFVADEPAQAVEIGLVLADAMHFDALLPDVRVGLATGGVVSRLGDIFGTTVNLASRLTALANPGEVLVDPVTAAAVQGRRDFTLTPEPVREVRGLGNVGASQVRRTGGDVEPAAGSAAQGAPR